MFRKQKVKQQLVIVGEGRPRLRVILPSELESTRRGRVPAALVRVTSQQGMTAVIDRSEQAWLLGEPFAGAVNLSALLRRRVQRVFLGEKEAIVQSRGEFILLNWGSVKALEGRQLTRLSTYSTNDSEALLIAYLIADAPAAFHYSLAKKQDRLYEITTDCRVVAHPTLTAIRTVRAVKGVSVGRFHSLCWDAEGELFSWGSRSLALGLGGLPGSQVAGSAARVQLWRHVLMACAGTHYSVALTAEGVLYEWGIKPEFNQINEEPIFAPRPLDFRFFRCEARFVALKGREDNFAALASDGQLYVWGLNARHLLAPNIQLPDAWQGSHVYEPVLQTDFLGQRVRDFSIEVGSLSVIVGGEGEEVEPEEEYWQVLKEKAKLQLASFKGNRVRTDVSESLARLRKKYSNPLIADHPTHAATATERRVLLPPESKSAQKLSSQRTERRVKHESGDHSGRLVFKRTAPVSSACWPLPSPTPHKRQVSDFFTYSNPAGEAMALRCSEMGFSSGSRREDGQSQGKKFSESYSLRLQGVLEKKQKLESQSLATNLKRIDEGDVEFKLRKREEEEARKRRDKNQAILAKTLLPFLCKSFLTRTVCGPLDAGREALIACFSRSLVFVRVEKNIKRLFVDAKVKFSMQTLQKESLPRYALLALYFKHYVIRFRARRTAALRRAAVQAIVARVARDQLKAGVKRLAVPVGRVARVGQWLRRFNRERLRILKELWNNFVLVTLRPSDGGQINLHVSPEATFAERFSQAVEAKAVGSLQDFYRGAVRMGEARGTNKKSLSELRRRGQARGQEYKLSSAEMLPYSLHYNALRRPKQLEIALSEALRVSAGWLEVERRTLQEQLRGLLAAHDRAFWVRQREYELELAAFIRQRYDTFYELRWRFIIEYNKVERTPEKRRREKHLRRLLGLVGMQRLFDEDCIPEKSLVLEEALRRRDAPVPPSPLLPFDLTAFQDAFHAYWEALHAKAKQIRKRNP